jgi:hypothetical protein
MEYVITVLAFLAGGGCSVFISQKQIAVKSQEIASSEMRVRELEKQIHIKEREFLDEKNKIEVSHLQEMRAIREGAHKEGFDLGIVENEKDHLIFITNLKSEHLETIRKECARAADEAKSKLRAEMEMQTKMFSVSIRPYVKIIKDDGVFYDDYHSKVGYQYQLLINGIPAFQPHIIIEHEEKLSDFKEENVKVLIEQATKAAEIAMQLYLGGATSSMIKVSPELVERVTT